MMLSISTIKNIETMPRDYVSLKAAGMLVFWRGVDEAECLGTFQAPPHPTTTTARIHLY